MKESFGSITLKAITLIGMSASIVTYSFTTFVTKEEYKNLKADISTRLDRIENKLDRLIERKK